MNCHPFLVPAQRDSVGVVSDYGDPAAAQDNEAEAPTWQRVGEVAAELADIVYVIQLEPDFGFEYVSDSVTSIVGYSPTEHYADPLLGQRVLDPRDVGVLAEAMAIDVGGESDFTVRWIHAEGRVLWTQHHVRKQRRADGSVAVYGAARDVTSERAALAAAQSAELHYRRIIEDSAIGMCVVAADGRFVLVNDALCEFFGLTREELVARSWQELTHPDDVAVDLQQVQRVLDGEIGSYRLTKRYRHADGRYLVGDLSVSGIRDDEGGFVHFVSQIVDMTEAAWLQAEVEQSRRDYRILAEYSGDVIMRVAEDDTIRWASPATSRVLGWDPGDIVGMRTVDLVHPDDLHRLVRSSGTEPDSSWEARLRRQDGDHVWVHAVEQQVPVGDDERPYGVVRLRDISDMVAARRQLEYQAHHDLLTGLLTREEMYQRVERLRGRVQRTGSRAALIYADIDGLKQVNDTHGHATGDRYICHVSDQVRSVLRDDDLVARIGGDELLIAITGASDLADVRQVAEKISRSVAQQAEFLSDGGMHPDVSLGITFLHPDEPLERAVARADAAMYESKRRGPGVITVAESDPVDGADVEGVSRG